MDFMLQDNPELHELIVNAKDPREIQTVLHEYLLRHGVIKNESGELTKPLTGYAPSLESDYRFKRVVTTQRGQRVELSAVSQKNLDELTRRVLMSNEVFE